MHDELENNEELDELIPGTKKKSKHRMILDSLGDIDDFTSDVIDSPVSSESSFLASSFMKQKKKKDDDVDENADEWFGEMIASVNIKPKSTRGKDIFSPDTYKKKKKKKKKDGGPTDYNKEFETEINLYRNLLQDQTKFTAALQKEYDAVKATRSTSRGVTKNMTDMISNINSARQLSMQLVEKNVNTKKLINELTMKEKKELGAGAEGEGANLSDFASSYLKQMLNERSTLISGASEANVVDLNEQDLFENVSGILSADEGLSRSADADAYLKYENENVRIVVNMNIADCDDYYFYAVNANGEEVPDYPLPLHTQMSVNRSTNIATDEYGQKFHIEWRQ